MSAYSALDPDFRDAALEARLANLFIRLQQCRSAGNLDGLRPYLSDALLAREEEGLEDLRRKGHTLCVDRPAVFGVKLLGFRQEDGRDVIAAEIRARVTEYVRDEHVRDDETGATVGGSRKETFLTCVWELERASGMRSEKPGELTAAACPGCGAPMDLSQSAVCAYCGSPLPRNERDFILDKITVTERGTGR